MVSLKDLARVLLRTAPSMQEKTLGMVQQVG